jgi:hypothetical protein
MCCSAVSHGLLCIVCHALLLFVHMVLPARGCEAAVKSRAGLSIQVDWHMYQRVCVSQGQALCGVAAKLNL